MEQKNKELFKEALKQHIETASVVINGTFRGGQPVTHYYDPDTNLWAIVDSNGYFAAGWRLYPSQLIDLTTNGNVT